MVCGMVMHRGGDAQQAPAEPRASAARAKAAIATDDCSAVARSAAHAPCGTAAAAAHASSDRRPPKQPHIASGSGGFQATHPGAQLQRTQRALVARHAARVRAATAVHVGRTELQRQRRLRQHCTGSRPKRATRLGSVRSTAPSVRWLRHRQQRTERRVAARMQRQRSSRPPARATTQSSAASVTTCVTTPSGLSSSAGRTLCCT